MFWTAEQIFTTRRRVSVGRGLHQSTLSVARHAHTRPYATSAARALADSFLARLGTRGARTWSPFVSRLHNALVGRRPGRKRADGAYAALLRGSGWTLPRLAT